MNVQSADWDGAGKGGGAGSVGRVRLAASGTDTAVTSAAGLVRRSPPVGASNCVPGSGLAEETLQQFGGWICASTDIPES